MFTLFSLGVQQPKKDREDEADEDRQEREKRLQEKKALEEAKKQAAQHGPLGKGAMGIKKSGKS